jgi:hypothetical protein
MPDRLAEPVASPQDMLRELQRMMATPVSGVGATVSEKVGLGSQAGGANPNSAVDPLGNALRPRPGSVVTTARALPAVSRTEPRRRSFRALVGMMVLAALAAVGYYAYRQHFAVDTAAIPAASGDTKGRGSPAGGGAIVNLEADPVRPAPNASTSPVDTPPAATTRPVTPGPERSVAAIREDSAVAGDARRGGSDMKDATPGNGTGSAKLPSPAATRGTENPQRAGRGSDRSPEAAAAAAVLVPRAQTPGAGTRIEPPPPRLGPCTDAVAALGLCSPEPTQRRE